MDFWCFLCVFFYIAGIEVLSETLELIRLLCIMCYKLNQPTQPSCSNSCIPKGTALGTFSLLAGWICVSVASVIVSDLIYLYEPPTS